MLQYRGNANTCFHVRNQICFRCRGTASSSSNGRTPRISRRVLTKDVQNYDMGVSENYGTPKSSILIGFSIINHPFWGTPIFGNIHIPSWETNFPGGYNDIIGMIRGHCHFPFHKLPISFDTKVSQKPHQKSICIYTVYIYI